MDSSLTVPLVQAYCIPRSEALPSFFYLQIVLQAINDTVKPVFRGHSKYLKESVHT